MEPMSEGLVIHDLLGLRLGSLFSLCEAVILNSPVSFSMTGASSGDQALPSHFGHPKEHVFLLHKSPALGNILSWFLCFGERKEGTVAGCRRQALSDTVCR